RIAQLPTAIVHARWYSMEIAPLKQWCTYQQARLEELDEKALVSEWDRAVADVFHRLGSEPCMRFEDERLLQVIARHSLSQIGKQLENVERALVKSSLSVATVAGELTTDCQEFLREVSQQWGGL